MENANYFFAAFAAIWAAVFGYVIFLHRRQRKLEQEVDLLQEMVDEKDDQP